MSILPLDQRHQNKHLTERPVDAQWHTVLDTYGSFCITVPLNQILEIINKLDASNRDWERRAKDDPDASRNLEVCAVGGPLHIPIPPIPLR